MTNEHAQPEHKFAKSDHLIRFGFFAGLGLATLCLVFTVVYIWFYSRNTTTSFDAFYSENLNAKSIDNLTGMLIARTAQNKTLLQSCGVVSGIAFGFLGFSLFLLGIRGDTDASGSIQNYSFNLKRLAPGSLIMLASIGLVGISAVHRIEFRMGPAGVSTGDATDQGDQGPASRSTGGTTVDESWNNIDNSSPGGGK
jgi:hypothetical protein